MDKLVQQFHVTLQTKDCNIWLDTIHRLKGHCNDFKVGDSNVKFAQGVWPITHWKDTSFVSFKDGGPFWHFQRPRCPPLQNYISMYISLYYVPMSVCPSKMVAHFGIFSHQDVLHFRITSLCIFRYTNARISLQHYVPKSVGPWMHWFVKIKRVPLSANMCTCDMREYWCQ